MKKINLVLGGGGARGFCHLGVIKALNEKGYTINAISGVSAGAIAGAFYCAGISPDETLDILKEKRFFDFSRIHLPIDGLLSLEGLEDQLNKAIPHKNIEDLETTLFVAVTNLNDGDIEYKDHGPLGKTVLASASLPVLFSPVSMNGKQYVDGGVLDNFPVKPFAEESLPIVGVNVSPLNKLPHLENLIQITQRMFQLGVNKQTEINKLKCNYVIEPEGLRKYDILDGSKADELFNIGYEYASELKFED